MLFIFLERILEVQISVKDCSVLRGDHHKVGVSFKLSVQRSLNLSRFLLISVIVLMVDSIFIIIDYQGILLIGISMVLIRLLLIQLIFLINRAI